MHIKPPQNISTNIRMSGQKNPALWDLVRDGKLKAIIKNPLQFVLLREDALYHQDWKIQ
jgi:hypothetical protein